jgi:hypothetical protein
MAAEFRQIVLGVFTRYMAGDALFELEIRERKLALEQGNWHERRSAPSSATGLGEERRFHSRAAVEKHSMKCVCAKALCLRHIHHIQAAPIHHIQANAYATSRGEGTYS